MTHVYHAQVSGRLVGVCANLGDAIECLFKVKFPNRNVDALPEFALQGGAIKGNKYDRMIRALYHDCSNGSDVYEFEVGPAVLKHDLLAHEVFIFPHSSPTVVLQQALFDLAEGEDPEWVRGKLVDRLERMIPSAFKEPTWSAEFLSKNRRTAQFLGAEFRQALLGDDDQVGPEHVQAILRSLTSNATNEFDKVVAAMPDVAPVM